MGSGRGKRQLNGKGTLQKLSLDFGLWTLDFGRQYERKRFGTQELRKKVFKSIPESLSSKLMNTAG